MSSPAEKALSSHLAALFRLNMELSNNGLPFYHYGGVNFNTDYRPYPPPGWVGMWRPPFIRLDKIYLIYKVESSEQRDIVFDVPSSTIRITTPVSAQGR